MPSTGKITSRNRGQVIKRGESKFLVRAFLGKDADGKRIYANWTIYGEKIKAELFLDGIVQEIKEKMRATCPTCGNTIAVRGE
jgi:hypothetical protein